MGEQLGMVTTADHALFGEFPRLKSVIGLSRSATQANSSPMLGENTAASVARYVGWNASSHRSKPSRHFMAFSTSASTPPM